MSTATQAPAEAPAKGGRKKKLLIIVVTLLLAAGAAYWFVLRPGPAEADKPEPGEVVALEAIQINLADGHYLRLGLALQLTTEAAEADGSKALDAAIEVFSGAPVSELNQPVRRENLKEVLMDELERDYHGEVMDVYFTDFVTQ